MRNIRIPNYEKIKEIRENQYESKSQASNYRYLNREQPRDKKNGSKSVAKKRLFNVERNNSIDKGTLYKISLIPKNVPSKSRLFLKKNVEVLNKTTVLNYSMPYDESQKDQKQYSVSQYRSDKHVIEPKRYKRDEYIRNTRNIRNLKFNTESVPIELKLSDSISSALRFMNPRKPMVIGFNNS